jgi:hypothetical protein
MCTSVGVITSNVLVFVERSIVLPAAVIPLHVIAVDTAGAAVAN